MEPNERGALAHVTDNLGVHDYTYYTDGQLHTESLPQIPGGVLSHTYDSVGRRHTTELQVAGTTLLTWTWQHNDDTGLLEEVTDGYCKATYGYAADSALVETIACSSGTTDRLLVTRHYTGRDWLDSIVATDAATPATTFYSWACSEFTDDGRRKRLDLQVADPANGGELVGTYWECEYNGIDQLGAATCRSAATHRVIAGREFSYDHDTIGNRKTAGRLDLTTEAGGGRYTSNNLNQYTLRFVPGAVYVSGHAASDATVTVNGKRATRDGEAFESRLPVDNANGPTTLDLAIRAVRFDAQADQDVIATASGQVAVPAANETLDVAGKGGLAADSMLVYEWDIEDRLVAVETATGAPGTVRKRLEFLYDYQGRRAVRKTYIWNSGTATWDLDEDRRYVYDGWNLVAEFNQQSTISNLKCSYLWGLDLAGLRDGQPGQESGGIGGLVAMSDWTSGSRTASRYAVADGNGNIVVLVDADSAAGAIETVDYDPFGNVLARRQTAAGVSGPSLCRFGFSSKYLDADTGLLYFGYRYYSPDLGRWLARDPLQEQGGDNLYAYCQNDPTNAVDPLGLKTPVFEMAWLWIIPLGWEKARWKLDEKELAKISSLLKCIALVDEAIGVAERENDSESVKELNEAREALLGYIRAIHEWTPGNRVNVTQTFNFARYEGTEPAWKDYLRVVAVGFGTGFKAGAYYRIILPSPTIPERPLNPPSARHTLTRVGQNTSTKDLNTVIAPGVDVASDVRAINEGLGIRVGETYRVHGRVYGVHNGTLYPISGNGFFPLSRGGFKALGVLNKFGNTARAAEIMKEMGITEEALREAMKAFEAGNGL